MTVCVGQKLGPYEIVSPLGKGGMGEVWKARDTRLGRDVAIKISAAQFSERFEREARAVAALNHPNICHLYDIGPNYLVMEYIDGRLPQGPLALGDAVRLALQIAGALAHAHGRGILHRDLKPANILVTVDGTAKLLDFGLAKLREHTNSDLTETIEGTVLGTAAYMAPEQAQGKTLDERSDIFSFGTVLYEMVSGDRAFAGNSMVDVLSAVVRDEPRPLKSSPEMVRLVMHCLQKKPADRFQTMADIKAALEALSEKRSEAQPSIAVLPFANMSRDADDEYFSDGLAEEIINALTQVAELKVIARTSAFAFKGKNEDIRKIAETLGVTNVLEGSVRRAGSRLRITAQLIHAADGTHLWSQRYDREMTDVFAVQDEIAAAIVEALQIKLTGKPAAARQYEPNLPAYEAFLKGRHQVGNSSPEAFARAEEYFKQAIALDPQWSEPHSALGQDYFFLGMHGLRSLSEMVPLARTEARNALELVSSDPVAHAVLGAIAASHDYDWKEASERFRLATASDSVPPAVHDMYAVSYLLPLGHFEQALEQHAKAIEKDPLNLYVRGRLLFTLVWAEMYERAIAEGRAALEIDNRNWLAHLAIAAGHYFQGKLVEALEPAEEAVRHGGWAAGSVAFLAGLLVQTGEKERAQTVIASMRGAVSVGMTIYHLMCSDVDAAIDSYERAIEEHQPFAAQTASAGGLFKLLRSSPRWPKLAKMMNLPSSAS